MTKTRILTISTFVLLISNLVLVSLLLFQHPRPPHHEGPKELIATRLNFDEQQMAAYEVIIEKHQGKIQEVDEQIRSAKNELYSGLYAATNEQKEELMNQLAAYQKQLEEIHLQHFIELKNICKENQLKDFDLLMNDVAAIFGAPKRRHPRR